MPEPKDQECAEEERLFAELKHALAMLVETQSAQLVAVAAGDRQTSALDQEIHIALSAWQRARYAYMRHVMDHECRFSNDLIATSELFQQPTRFSSFELIRSPPCSDTTELRLSM
jgi:hypothetical protein